ncbi:MAG: 1-acyl-sn-glycerol-3-phosphate acyltransferase [Clostridiales bacterium]|nr:1-acyl-sn-glycerol-3-phosphate acyltransferase [Clostridiales bacterium]
MNTQKKWIKKYRHPIVRNIIVWATYPFTRFLYGCKPERFTGENGRPHLVLFNHQTVFDQFIVQASFRRPIYFVGTEDLFSMGIVSRIIRFFCSPIPFRKQSMDVAALRTMMKIAREGGTMALAPEGNITYSGKTEYIRKSIVSLVKALKLPVALYRIDGGFGVQPRWSNAIRRGVIHAGVVRVIEPEEAARCTDAELYDIIKSALKVNEARDDGRRYVSNRRAEHLERVAYWCPRCGLSAFRSKGNLITCDKCGQTVEYGEDKRLRGVGLEFPYEWYSDWYDAQQAFIRSIDPDKYAGSPLFRDRADLMDVIVYRKKKRLRKNAKVTLYGDRIVLDENAESALTLRFSDITVAAVQLRNKLNLQLSDGKLYQLKGSRCFNAVKYINLFYRYQFIHGVNRDELYLGF